MDATGVVFRELPERAARRPARVVETDRPHRREALARGRRTSSPRCPAAWPAGRPRRGRDRRPDQLVLRDGRMVRLGERGASPTQQGRGARGARSKQSQAPGRTTSACPASRPPREPPPTPKCRSRPNSRTDCRGVSLPRSRPRPTLPTVFGNDEVDITITLRLRVRVRPAEAGFPPTSPQSPTWHDRTNSERRSRRGCSTELPGHHQGRRHRRWRRQRRQPDDRGRAQGRRVHRHQHRRPGAADERRRRQARHRPRADPRPRRRRRPRGRRAGPPRTTPTRSKRSSRAPTWCS